MTSRDYRPLAVIAVRTLLPALMGAGGALFAMLSPINFNSFCGIA